MYWTKHDVSPDLCGRKFIEKLRPIDPSVSRSTRGCLDLDLSRKVCDQYSPKALVFAGLSIIIRRSHQSTPQPSHRCYTKSLKAPISGEVSCVLKCQGAGNKEGPLCGNLSSR